MNLYLCENPSQNCNNAVGLSRTPITPPSVFRILLFCSWAWSIPIFEKTQFVFQTVKKLFLKALYVLLWSLSKAEKSWMNTGIHLEYCMIESKEPRKNSLQTFQKSVEITYANRLDEHEIECFHFCYSEPVLDVDWMWMLMCFPCYIVFNGAVFGRIRLTDLLWL